MPDSERSNAGDSSDPDEAIEDAAIAVVESTSSWRQSLEGWLDSLSWVPEWLVSPASTTILLVFLLSAAWLVYIAFRPLILKWVRRVVEKSAFTWDDKLFGHGVFRWLTHLLPGILILLFSPGFFSDTPMLASALTTGAKIYLLISLYFVLDSLLNAVQAILRGSKLGAHLNLTSIAQVIKLLAALVIFLLCFAALLQKPPLALLSGIGVLASVLMLVFKDVILGFVAGIQLATNRMLSVGDWLEMPSRSADGDVEEIGLTTVKVRNFDKTVTTIPTYALITDSFKNWRGMSESDGRRIKRSLLMDTNSIRLATPEMLDRFREVEHIQKFLTEREKEVADFNAKLGQTPEKSRVNGRRLTNIGVFRAYVEAYLRHHPNINQEMTLLVRQLAPDGRGLPLEIYCFSQIKDWARYESIQADIFDHLIAVSSEFDLRIFQEPSGLDFQGLGASNESSG